MKYIWITLFLWIATTLHATPSSVFWTVCTTDVQPTGVLHPGVDNYFSVFQKRGGGEAFPTDLGLTYGLFDWKGLKSEIGVDYFAPADDPLFFNAKIGVEEGFLFKHAPAINLGIFNIGTRRQGAGRTDQNIVDLIFGKSLPECIGGRLFVAAYTGSRALGKNRQGFMVAFDRSFLPAIYCDGREFHRIVVAADFASGKNTIGGGGGGFSYFFTPDISLLTGPVFFNDASINGKWKWTVQLDINVPICPPKKNKE